jgi:ABC-type glycerol-3-phosphate transport system substrate-binding protein
MFRHGLAFGLTLAALMLAPLAARSQTAAAPDWQRTLAAARQEGVVVVAMGPTQARRDFLLRQWKADYPDIALSLTIAPRSFVPNLVTERAAGKFLWDVFCGGPNTGISMIKADLLDPLMPEIVLPENTDLSDFGGAEDAFFDPQKRYMLSLVIDLTSPAYNAKLIAPAKAAALGLNLMLEPEVKGKIAWYDPRTEGPGAPFLVLIAKVLGDDKLRRILTDQDPVFVANLNDVATSVVRGRAVIGLGSKPREIVAPFKEAGLDVDVRPLGNTPETAYRTTDGATLAVIQSRPHPNAARLFVNWILSPRISGLMAKATEFPSRRASVPPLDPLYTPIAGAAYVDAQRDENDAVMRHWQAETKRLRPQ